MTTWIEFSDFEEDLALAMEVTAYAQRVGN